MNEELLMFIKKCQKNYDKPDIHSFNISIKGGCAFVVCRSNHDKKNVHAELYINGSAEEIANILNDLDADYDTIDM